MGLAQICPVLIVRDGAATIAATLRSLSRFPEVVVYENGSLDDTLAICERFANVRVVRGEFIGFGPTKNRAASYARASWILSIDADERLGEELLSGLEALDLRDACAAYALHRHNLFMGKDVRRGGWGNNWLVRLYHRDVCRFTEARVHEKVTVPADVRVARLGGALWHDAVTDVDQFLQKISRYSALSCGGGNRLRSPPHIAAGAVWAFLRSYFLQLGFLEGWRGLVIANCDAQGTFFKHLKRYLDARSCRDAAANVDDRPYSVRG
jgi:glycosyltransferase involved in cell wall biosynthesis